MPVQEVEETNEIIDITAMKICNTNNAVEFDPSAKTFKENNYKGGGVLTLGEPLLIRLLNVYLQTWILQFNHSTSSAQIIWIIIISIKG